jgi:thioredoxin reductase (NADPH)
MIYDSIIIGAGPAGLSASIYLGRAFKKVLVVYSGPRRTSLATHIQNYLGFQDISGQELIALAMEQARRYDVKFGIATAKKVKISAWGFEVSTANASYESRSIIIASGIDDIFPDIDNLFEYIGKTFFTCLDCDGYHLKGKRVALIGNGDGVARTALAVQQLYGSSIAVLAGPKPTISPPFLERLKKDKVDLLPKNITHIFGNGGILDSVVLDDGEKIPIEMILSDLGYTHNDSFLDGLTLKRSSSGYIVTDENFQSSIPRMYAVGPLNTGPDQVSVAVGEGARAAMHLIESGLDFSV